MRQQVLAISLLCGSFLLFAAETDLKFYRPFGASASQPSLIIKEIHAGNCWQQSQRIKREDAWRCVVENKTYDPCFINPYGSHKEAICPQSPWVAESVQINLSAPVDNSQHITLDVSQAYPWAIELSTGEKCQALDEGQIFEGLPIRFSCENQSILFGHMQRCKTPWTILERKNGKVETVIVSRAWF